MVVVREERPEDYAAIRDAHILHSPASIGAALGPMAVLLAHQRAGIGSRLVEAGGRKLAAAGCPFVIVLGHPDFYPRFGFVPASARGITCEWEVPAEAFMVSQPLSSVGSSA